LTLPPARETGAYPIDRAMEDCTPPRRTASRECWGRPALAIRGHDGLRMDDLEPSFLAYGFAATRLL